MKRRAALLFFGIVFAILIAAVLVLQSHPAAEFVRKYAQRQASQDLYSDVKIGGASIRLVSLQPGITLTDITVRPKTPGVKQEFDEPTIRIDAARVVLRPLQLMAKRVDIERIELTHPHADLSVHKGVLHGLPLPLVEPKQYAGKSDAEATVKIRLDAILVKNGTLHFDADEPDIQVGLTHVKALATIEANDSVLIDMESDGRRLHLRAADADLEEELGALSGQVYVHGTTVELKDAHAEIGDVVADADGVVSLKKGPLNLDLSTVHVQAPLALVKEFEQHTPLMKGELDYHGGFSVKGTNVRARGNAKVDDFWLEKFHLGETDADVEMAGTRAVSPRMLINGAGGRIAGSAEMSWDTDHLVLGTKVTLDDASFAQILDSLGVEGSHVDARVSGDVAFEGPIDRDLDIKGTAKLTQKQFAWTTKAWNEPGPRETNLAVPAGPVGGAFELTEKGIRFSGIDATAGTSKLAVNGDLFFHGATDLTFSGSTVNLSEISPIGSVAITGAGPVTGGHVYGDFEHLVIDVGNVDLDGVKVAGFDFGRGRGPLRFEDLVLSSSGTNFTRGKSAYSGPWKVDFHAPASLAFAVETKNARVEDLADVVFGNLPASAYVHGGPISGKIVLNGPFEKLTGFYTANGAGITVQGETFAKLSARGRWDKGTIWLDDLKAAKPSGAEVYARGSLAPPPTESKEDLALGGVVNLEAHTARMTLADLDSVGPDASFASDLALRMSVQGRFNQPDVRGRLDLRTTAFRGTPLGASQVNFRTVVNPGTKEHAIDYLSFDGTLAGGSIPTDGHVVLWRTKLLPFVANFHPTHHNIKPYLYLLNEKLARNDELTAYTSGSVRVAGGVLDMGKSEVHTTLDKLDVTLGAHTLTNHEPIDATFGNGKVEIADLSLLGDDTHFHVHGKQDADGNLDFHAQGSLNLAFYDLIDSANVFTRIEGLLDVASLTINGTADQPIIQGEAEVHRAIFKARVFPQQVDEVHGKIHFSEEKVIFDGFRGKFGGGTFDGNGSLALAGFGVADYDLHGQVNESTLRFPSLSIVTRVTGPLSFTGSTIGQSRPILAGDLKLESMLYSENFDWKAKAFAFQRSHYVQVRPDEQSKLFDLDVTLRADDNIIMRNDLAPNGIEMRTVKDDPLRITGNSAQIGMLGSLELNPTPRVANKAVFQDKTFDVKSALLQFKKETEVAFHYETEVESVIRDWAVTVDIKGDVPGTTSYLPSSVPALPQEDINLLLVAGLTRQEATDKDATAALGVFASVAGPGIADQSKLSNFKKVLPLDSFDVVPSYSQGGQVGLKVQGRKQLTPNLELQGDFVLGNNGRGKVQLDYRVNKTLHLQGGWNDEDNREGTTQTVNPQGDVGADAKFRFEWK